MKKQPTEKQLAARKAFGEAAKARAAARKQEQVPTTEPVKVSDPSLADLQRRMDEIMETNALLKAALLRGNDTPGNSVGIGRGNQLVGEVDKYLVDPSAYPDPTKRLSEEPRLQTIAFNHNYELDYDFAIRPYETKTGINMREPEFTITLNRVVLNDQGERVQAVNPKTGKAEDKFYRAKRFMFHEDPQAALVIARENNIDIDQSDQKTFLDEMRYLRIRDWLFDVFWPKGSDPMQEIQEEVIGGTIVQVFTKSSVEPSAVEFDKLDKKVR